MPCELENNWFGKADWRYADQYPDETASPDRWAWEFLKRNEEFRRESDVVLAADNGAYQSYLERWGIARYWPADVIARDELDAPCAFRPAVAIARRLNGPRAAELAGQLGAASESVFVHPARDTNMAYVIDLSEPLEPQIDAIRVHAAGQQDSMGITPPSLRNQMNKYVYYLRAFDAHEAGVSASKIADDLSLELDSAISEKSVRDWIKVARELTHKRGYINIPRITHETAQKRGYLAHK